MIRWILALILTAGLATADYVIGWIPSSSAGDPRHEPITYRVFKFENGVTNHWDTYETNMTFKPVTNGLARIWVVTVNGNLQESEPSAVLTYPVQETPNAPENLRLTR